MNASFLIAAVVVGCSAAVHFSYYLKFDGPTWEYNVIRVTALIFCILECEIAMVLMAAVCKGWF